jgi:hypothetical protein
MPLSRVYKEIMYSELKDRPPPMRSQSKNKDKFCLYHRDHGHYTNEYIHLKDAMEKLIRQGKLKQFVQKSDEGTSRGARHLPEGVAPAQGTLILGEMRDEGRSLEVPSDMTTQLQKESLT